MKKSYIIVGDNNFWYAQTGNITRKEAQKLLVKTKKDIFKDAYTEDEYAGKPTSLFLFEGKKIAVLDF
jgi:hypothetical protein